MDPIGPQAQFLRDIRKKTTLMLVIIAGMPVSEIFLEILAEIDCRAAQDM